MRFSETGNLSLTDSDFIHLALAPNNDLEPSKFRVVLSLRRRDKHSSVYPELYWEKCKSFVTHEI